MKSLTVQKMEVIQGGKKGGKKSCYITAGSLIALGGLLWSGTCSVYGVGYGALLMACCAAA